MIRESVEAAAAGVRAEAEAARAAAGAAREGEGQQEEAPQQLSGASLATASIDPETCGSLDIESGWGMVGDELGGWEQWDGQGG